MIVPGRVGRAFTARELAERLNVATPAEEPDRRPSAAAAHATTVLCLAVLVWECAGLDFRHLGVNDLAIGAALVIVLLALALGAQWQHRLAVREYLAYRRQYNRLPRTPHA